MSTIDCSTCGARNRTDTRRCRICARVINRAVPELERGLAALHPDVGFGSSFGAAWGRSQASSEPTARDVGVDAEPGPTPGEADERRESTPVEAELAPRWSAVPITRMPQWEPTSIGTDDESVAVASTIVLDVPPRNGHLAPPLEYECERFDPDALDHGTRSS
jgi:hypothetical protein